MTDRADQPGKVTCVSCADKSICRAHFTSQTFFNLLQQTSVSNKHGEKTLFCPDCCHSSSASPKSFIFKRTLSFQFSVLSVLFGPNASPSPNIFHLFIFRSSSPWMEHSPCSGPGEPSLYCSNFVFFVQPKWFNQIKMSFFLIKILQKFLPIWCIHFVKSRHVFLNSIYCTNWNTKMIMLIVECWCCIVIIPGDN